MNKYDKDYYWQRVKLTRYFYIFVTFIILAIFLFQQGSNAFFDPFFYIFLLIIPINLVYSHLDRKMVYLLRNLDDEKFKKLHIYMHASDDAGQSPLTAYNYLNFIFGKEDFGSEEIRSIKIKLKFFILVVYFGFIAFIFISMLFEVFI